jgi:hypothetical protein
MNEKPSAAYTRPVESNSTYRFRLTTSGFGRIVFRSWAEEVESVLPVRESSAVVVGHLPAHTFWPVVATSTSRFFGLPEVGRRFLPRRRAPP